MIYLLKCIFLNEEYDENIDNESLITNLGIDY